VAIDSYNSAEAEALLIAGGERVRRHGRKRRELVAQGVGAAGFLVAAVLLAVIAPWHRSLSLESVLVVLVVWIVVERITFPVADGWTAPTMLVFVPALFVLPTPVVPLVAMLGLVLGRLPKMLRTRAHATMLPEYVADSWYTIGPALVIVLAGAEHFAWSHWPVYVGALLAQCAFDAAATSARCWVAEGTSPRVQLPLMTWTYITDALLAPLGLLIAAVSVNRPGLVLLALSPTAMLWLFARERRQRMEETLALSTAYRGTAFLLGDVVEADDHYTGAHSRDVVEMSVAVAEHLGLDASQKRNVEFTALLHDVGKIQVPKAIINKPGPLNDAEWAVMHRHTIAGEEMLRQVGGLLASVGRMVRATHERYDGGGYPDGLVGEQIPIGARIVSSCDAFSAMTTNRSYRDAMPVGHALAELRRCAGTQFDPQVVAVIEQLAAPAVPRFGPQPLMVESLSAEPIPVTVGVRLPA
jgi:HD-GYP domain-containing protein (c-di-GMP phosphodiesterase class II)